MAEIVGRKSWGGVLPLGRHASISGSRPIHAPSVSIAPPPIRRSKTPVITTGSSANRPYLRREPRLGAERSGCAAPSLGVSLDTDHDQRAEDHPRQSGPFGARQAAWQREPSLQDDGLLARQLLPLQGPLRHWWRARPSGAHPS